jgi:hypothetical protein
MGDEDSSRRAGDAKVIIELTGDEALVFFDWIARFNEREDVVFDDQAEQRVLWDIECILESALAEPFAPNYDQLLAAARENVREMRGYIDAEPGSA